MGKNIHSFLKLITCFILILSTTGCWNSRELDTIAIVVGVGLDKPQENGNIQITAQVVKPESLKSGSGSNKTGGGSDGTSGSSYWNIVNTDVTTFKAIRGFTHESSRKLFFPHNQLLIFSEDLAKTGIAQYIDFFLRDPEPRMSMYVLVSRGNAEEILNVKPKIGNLPAAYIADLVKAQGATSESLEVDLKDFATKLVSKSTAPVAPIIDIQKTGELESVHMQGLAVFKNGKFVGELNAKETRGLLWVLGKVKSGIILVDDPADGGKVSLEIIKAGRKIKPEIKDDKMIFHLKIKEDGNIGDESGTTNLTEPTVVQKLETLKSEVIKSEITAAFNRAQELNADIFGFGETLHEEKPKEWKELKNKWDSSFKSVEITIDVDAKLRLAGKINKPISSQE